MYFQSFLFIFLILPIIAFIYYVFKQNKIVIFIISILFYLMIDFKYFLLLFLVCGLTYLFGKTVKNNKKIYILYMVCLVLLLLVFKSWDLIIKLIKLSSFSSIAIPVGLSYYVFKAISYISDVYRGKYESSSLYRVSFYLTYFPTVLQGPIIRFDGFNKWLDSKVNKPSDAIANGFRRYIIGLAKVSIFAPSLLTLSNVSFEESYILNPFLTWIGVIGFASMLYFDFSGNSDMSIGISAMLGYTVEENFNHPYESLTVSEFFNRWHITLGSFFKEYVYIPLGGNRKGIIRTIINIMIVWLLTGLWHSNNILNNYNFIIWGLFLGIIISLEKIVYKKVSVNKYIKKLITIFNILISWVIFNTNNIKDLLRYVKRMFIGDFMTMEYINFLNIYYYIAILVIGLFLCYKPVREKISLIFAKHQILYDTLLLGVLIISIIFIIINGQYSPMYVNF